MPPNLQSPPVPMVHLFPSFQPILWQCRAAKCLQEKLCRLLRAITAAPRGFCLFCRHRWRKDRVPTGTLAHNRGCRGALRIFVCFLPSVNVHHVLVVWHFFQPVLKQRPPTSDVSGVNDQALLFCAACRASSLPAQSASNGFELFLHGFPLFRHFCSKGTSV